VDLGQRERVLLKHLLGGEACLRLQMSRTRMRVESMGYEPTDPALEVRESAPYSSTRMFTASAGVFASVPMVIAGFDCIPRAVVGPRHPWPRASRGGGWRMKRARALPPATP